MSGIPDVGDIGLRYLEISNFPNLRGTRLVSEKPF